MPIETDFRFNQVRDPAVQARLALGTVDLLGPLRAFIGDNAARTWRGKGFNLIWRPHDGTGPNGQDFFLELDVTQEKLSFRDITGDQGIANRGLKQGDIALGGLAYVQEVSENRRTPPKKLHFEPGVWLNVPQTTSPAEPGTVVRMGSIPHGTTISAQGIAVDTTVPVFSSSSITPFRIGQPDDGHSGLVPFPEGTQPLTQLFPSRTVAKDVVGISDAQFQDPSQLLVAAIAGQNIVATKVFIITTNVNDPGVPQAPAPTAPREGGGIDNIAFLAGGTGGPNADAAKLTATFWIETVQRADGSTFEQLQYIQRVLLNFNGLSWPHVSVATLKVRSQSKR